MPTKADDSPNIAFPLPEVKPAFSVDNVFPEEMFQRIKNKIKQIPWGPNSEYFYHTSMGRWESPISFDQDIEEYALNKARELFGNPNLQQTYFYTVRYQKQNGNIPHLHKHMDQNGCEQTIDICIEKEGVEWGIEVDEVVFPEKENSAVFFYGQQQVHSRPTYPEDASEDAYLTVLFLHYVRPEHWWIQSYNEGGIDKVREVMGKYSLDGDVRFFEHAGYISQPQLPEGQERCECHNYLGVPSAVADRIAEIENNKLNGQ
jgi:hypothetical protein